MTTQTAVPSHTKLNPTVVKATNKMKHYLSDSGIWKVIAEFVDPNGRVMHSEGESVVGVSKTGIVNDVWVSSDEINRRNTYLITVPQRGVGGMETSSQDPDQPCLRGTFNVDRNILHFKYRMDGSAINGYEIITRKKDTCYVYGENYDGEKLLATWTAMMNKKKMQKTQTTS
jgi:hypothetical protein